MKWKKGHFFAKMDYFSRKTGESLYLKILDYLRFLNQIILLYTHHTSLLVVTCFPILFYLGSLVHFELIFSFKVEMRWSTSSNI